MKILTVSARGQVTLCKDVLQHLGVRPGDKIQFDKLPDGSVTLRAVRPKGSINAFIGVLSGKSTKVATLGDIEEAAAAGWAGED